MHVPSASFVESLERRTLLAAATSPFLDADRVADEGWIVIRYGEEGGLYTTVASSSGSRVGIFTLPSIRHDGSARMTGSNTDDAITIEATAGYDESLINGRPADAEHDFLNVIDPKTGDRFSASGADVAGARRQLASERSALADEQFRLGSIEADENYADREAAIAESKATIDVLTKAIGRLDAVATQAANGRFVRYTLGRVYDYYVQVADDQTATARVTVDGDAGNDTISISPNVPYKATINGGSGADVLTTGKKTTNVFAGGGKDRLINRSTKGATLDGGQGADRYYNRTATDVNVIGRADGDQMITPIGSFRVFQAAFVSSTPDANGYFALRSTTLTLDDHGNVIIDYVKPTA